MANPYEYNDKNAVYKTTIDVSIIKFFILYRLEATRKLDQEIL